MPATYQDPVFVVLRFSQIIPNANQAAWLSGGLLKDSHPNAEVRHFGTARRYGFRVGTNRSRGGVRRRCRAPARKTRQQYPALTSASQAAMSLGTLTSADWSAEFLARGLTLRRLSFNAVAPFSTVVPSFHACPFCAPSLSVCFEGRFCLVASSLSPDSRRSSRASMSASSFSCTA